MGFLFNLLLLCALQVSGVISPIPSNVLVFVGETSVCGGAILNKKYIITAASCLFNEKVELLDSKDITIALLTGAGNLNADITRIPVTAIYAHNQYNPYTFEDDIAVLLLSIELEFPLEDGDPDVLGAVLNTRIVSDDKDCTIASWTKTDSKMDLKLIPIKIHNRISCIEKQKHQVQETMICAGELNYNDCDVISPGSGLYCDNSLTGIYSFGIECKADYIVGIFTQIRMFDDWIKRQFRRRDLPKAGPTRPPPYTDGANGKSISVVLILFNIFIFVTA